MLTGIIGVLIGLLIRHIWKNSRINKENADLRAAVEAELVRQHLEARISAAQDRFATDLVNEFFAQATAPKTVDVDKMIADGQVELARRKQEEAKQAAFKDWQARNAA